MSSSESCGMSKFLSGFWLWAFSCEGAASWALFPTRAALGVIMAAHGAQKVLGWFGGMPIEEFAKFIGGQLGLHPALLFAHLAGWSEFAGGVLLILGLATRPAALFVMMTMLVAMFGVHWGHFFLDDHGIEYTLILAAAAFTLVWMGGGRWSIDALMAKCCSKKHAQPNAV